MGLQTENEDYTHNIYNTITKILQSYKYSILFEEFLPNIAKGLKGPVATVVDPRYDALIQFHVSRSSDKNPT